MEEQDWILGNEPVCERLNVRAELELFRDDPLFPLVEALAGDDAPWLLENEFTRYLGAYEFYHRSLERFLPEISVVLRWERGPRWVKGRGRKYTPAQQELAKKYHAIKKFVEYDFFNCLLHARVLADRTIALSRYFLDGSALPSFTSFNDHKKFFQRLKSPYGRHEEYAVYIWENTNWFDMPLKPVRDKFLVHAGPKHMKSLGYDPDYYDLTLILLVPVVDDPEKPWGKLQPIVVSIRRLARDIKQFLNWYCQYGLHALQRGH